MKSSTQKADMQREKVLVTGGAGFIGTHLVNSLLERNYRVTVLDNFHTSSKKSFEMSILEKEVEVICADITAPLSDDLKADFIYHLACPASPVRFGREPVSILHTCFLGTDNVLKAAHRWNARVLLASTSEVYGQSERDPQDETHFGNVNCFGPRSCYDEGKRVAESLAWAYRHEFGVDIRIARIFNCYGPGMLPSDGRVICSFIPAALSGQPLIINGDGQSTRCFQYVDDCVAGLQSLMHAEHTAYWKGGPVNIGCEQEITIENLAHIILGEIHRFPGDAAGRLDYVEALPDDPLQRRPDCSLAKQLLGWEMTTPLKEGLWKTIRWYEQLEVDG